MSCHHPHATHIKIRSERCIKDIAMLYCFYSDLAYQPFPLLHDLSVRNHLRVHVKSPTTERAPWISFVIALKDHRAPIWDFSEIQPRYKTILLLRTNKARIRISEHWALTDVRWRTMKSRMVYNIYPRHESKAGCWTWNFHYKHVWGSWTDEACERGICKRSSLHFIACEYSLFGAMPHEPPPWTITANLEHWLLTDCTRTGRYSKVSGDRREEWD